jgi:hypothetical protein
MFYDFFPSSLFTLLIADFDIGMQMMKDLTKVIFFMILHLTAVVN